MEQIKFLAVTEAMARNNGDKSAAAKELAIGRTTLYRIIGMIHRKARMSESPEDESTKGNSKCFCYF